MYTPILDDSLLLAKCRRNFSNRVINETDDRNTQQRRVKIYRNIKIFSSSLMGVESITCKMTVTNNAPLVIIENDDKNQFV